MEKPMVHIENEELPFANQAVRTKDRLKSRSLTVTMEFKRQRRTTDGIGRETLVAEFRWEGKPFITVRFEPTPDSKEKTLVVPPGITSDYIPRFADWQIFFDAGLCWVIDQEVMRLTKLRTSHYLRNRDWDGSRIAVEVIESWPRTKEQIIEILIHHHGFKIASVFGNTIVCFGERRMMRTLREMGLSINDRA